MRPRSLRTISAVVLAVTSSFLSPDEASATPNAGVTRLAGVDRIETAVSLSRDAWAADGASAAVLATSGGFPDALAGGPLASKKAGPLLLTGSAGLDPRTAAELDRVLRSGAQVFLLGGTAVLSDAVEQQVRSRGYSVVRYGGVNRYDTAVKVTRDGLGNPSTLFVVDGLAFAEPLAGAAAASKAGAGVVLSAGPTMPPETSSYVQTRSGVTRFAIGGNARTADPGATAIVGADQYDTSRLIAARFFSSPTSVALASGENFPDALSGGPHISTKGGPLLLTASTVLPTSVDAYLRANTDTVARGYIYGGTGAISPNAESQFANAMRNTRTFGSGTHRVPADVAPGTYRTRTGSSGCYWERLSGFSGEFEDIIANDFTNYPSVVTIASSDAGFKSERCATWTSDLSAITASPSGPFGSGTFIVGTDLSAGTWRAPGGSSCYWARLSGFSGEFEDIIANDIGSTNVVVTISSNDAGFESNDCGEWTRQS